jgi:hypothetical protein
MSDPTELKKSQNTEKEIPLTLEALAEYYEKTKPDCKNLLEGIDSTLLALRQEAGWSQFEIPTPESNTKKKVLTLEELQSLFAGLLEKHGEILKKSWEGLEKDHGYVPLLTKLLEDQIKKETLRLKTVILTHIKTRIETQQVTPEETIQLIETLKKEPIGIGLLSAELQERMPTWQKHISEYTANYPYCQLLHTCAQKTLTHDHKKIQEAIKAFQNFEHPFQKSPNKNQ